MTKHNKPKAKKEEAPVAETEETVAPVGGEIETPEHEEDGYGVGEHPGFEITNEEENEIPSGNPVEEEVNIYEPDEDEDILEIPDDEEVFDPGYASQDPTDLGMVDPDVLLPGQGARIPAVTGSSNKFHFGHALSYLLDGAKVTRAAWEGGRYLKFIPADGEGGGFIQDVRPDDTQAFGWKVSQNELLSQDWFVVTESEVANVG